jgi:hypothetical protein
MSEERVSGSGGGPSVYFTLYLGAGFMSPPLDPSRRYVSLTPAATQELQAFLVGLFKGRPSVAA